jgi:hypothetical protein
MSSLVDRLRIGNLAAPRLRAQRPRAINTIDANNQVVRVISSHELAESLLKRANIELELSIVGRRSHCINCGIKIKGKGKTGKCKPCSQLRGSSDEARLRRLAANREWARRNYVKNREKILARTREYQKNNKNKILEKNRRSYAENRSSRLAYASAYRKNNRDKIDNWRKENKLKIRAHRLKSKDRNNELRRKRRSVKRK